LAAAADDERRSGRHCSDTALPWARIERKSVFTSVICRLQPSGTRVGCRAANAVIIIAQVPLAEISFASALIVATHQCLIKLSETTEQLISVRGSPPHWQRTKKMLQKFTNHWQLNQPQQDTVAKSETSITATNVHSSIQSSVTGSSHAVGDANCTEFDMVDKVII
jgi:hypothetical protein